MGILTNKVCLDITLEGVDGAGKSTVATLLVEKFAKLGFEAVIVKAPDDRFRDFLTKNSFSRAGKVMLYLADMIESYQNIVVPHLREGRVVIMDRSILSTFVYQKLLPGYCDDSETRSLREVIDAYCDLVSQYSNDLRKTSLMAFLDISAKVAMSRSSAHEKDEYEDAGFQEWSNRVRMYRDMFKKIGEFTVDAEKLSADEVAESILQESLRRYRLMLNNQELAEFEEEQERAASFIDESIQFQQNEDMKPIEGVGE